MDPFIRIVQRICFAAIFAAVLCAAEYTRAQPIISDVQSKDTIDQLDRLKERDAKDAREVERTMKLKRYPLVVFIPGILGSKIEECDKQNNTLVNCTWLWGHKDWNFSTTDLSIKPNKSYRTSVLDNFKALGKEVDFYGEGLAYIYQQIISDNDSLIPYPYDWRQDNRLSALNLQKYLCELSDVQKERPIVFVAHSMGGLVLKYWLGRIHEKQSCPDGAPLKLKIEEAIFVGTPHFGAPEAIKAFADGFKLGQDSAGVFGIVKNIYSRNTIENELNRYGTMFPGAYQLLPIYGDQCAENYRIRMNWPSPVAPESGIFDLFSPKAWQDVHWPKHIPSNVGRATFYNTHLPKFLKDARDFLCVVAGVTLPSNIRITYFASESHDTMAGAVLEKIPYGNAQSTNPKTIGFVDPVAQRKGDGTVLYEIAINSPDTSAERHRQFPTEKHEFLLNSRQFRLHIDRLYRAVQASINEELLSNPENRTRLAKVYLDSGRNIFASLPDVTDANDNTAGTLTAAQVRARFPNVVAFNRSLMEARGLTVADLQRSTEQSNARSIVLALQDQGIQPNRRFASYPQRPIRIVVNFSPGGSTDLAARLLGQKLGEAWGQPVVVENVAGGGGAIGIARAAQAPPDGYSLVLTNNTAFTVSAYLYPRLFVDPVRQFVPVSRIASVPEILAVNNAVPASTLQELLALAREKPASLSYASSGLGSSQHLAGELLKATAHVDIQHVPYRGSGPALNDLTGQHVSMIIGNSTIILPLVREGKLRALAVTSSKRTTIAPDLPTIAEAGVAGYDASAWLGLFAPAGTPSDIVNALQVETAKILAQPDVRAKFSQFGMEAANDSPEQFTAVVKSDAAKWSAVLKAAGIKAE